MARAGICLRAGRGRKREWTSVHDHEEGFRKRPAFASFLAKVKPFFADLREMKHYARESGGARG